MAVGCLEYLVGGQRPGMHLTESQVQGARTDGVDVVLRVERWTVVPDEGDLPIAGKLSCRVVVNLLSGDVWPPGFTLVVLAIANHAACSDSDVDQNVERIVVAIDRGRLTHRPPSLRQPPRPASGRPRHGRPARRP